MSVTRFGGGRVALTHPAQYLVVTFAAFIAVGTVLLWLPVSAAGAHGAPFATALFTAASAACVTGLGVVDTATYWSGFGEGVILLLVQVGGLGIMTLTSLLVLVLSRRLGLRQRVLAASQTGALGLGDVKALVFAVVKLTAVAESAVTVVLFIRFLTRYHEPAGRALYLAVFHAVSAFNSAGIALFSDSLMSFRRDPLLLLTLSAAVFVGGLGVPVWHQIVRHWRRPSHWDLHTKMTVYPILALTVAGWLAFCAFEWRNPGTFGSLSTADSLTNGLFKSISARTAGFTSLDVRALDDTSHLMTVVLMFIGGGSGSTAGGIKVTTFALLGAVMWAEVRGERDVVVFKRRIPADIQRQALTVAVMGAGAAIGATLVLLILTPYPLTDAVFEAVSALATGGLSTGITASLAVPAQLFVTALMLVGRIGPPTLFAALVLRDRERLYRYPEERIIIG